MWQRWWDQSGDLHPDGRADGLSLSDSVDFARTDDPRAIRFMGDGFAMTVTEGPCSNGMSDALWSDRVQLSFGEGVLKGCGGIKDGGE